MNIQISEDALKKMTPREIQVARYFAEGLTAKEVADRLSIAFNTVRVHRSNILRKMGYKNTVDMAASLTRGGII